MISFNEVMHRVTEVSYCDDVLIDEITDLYNELEGMNPSEAFTYIFHLYGPNMEVLVDICWFFGINISRYTIYYEADGNQYEAQCNGIVDDYNTFDVERIERLYNSLKRLLD